MPTAVSSFLTKLDMIAVRDHYDVRDRVHAQLRGLFLANDVDGYAKLALGICDSAGNYSAAEHGLGPQILTANTSHDVFSLAEAIEACATAHHLPDVIYREGIKYLKISVGSEMAMMLKPDVHWVGNKRTIWCHLLVKHMGSVTKANDELALYNDKDSDSEMYYPIWRDIYLAIEANLLQLGREASVVAAGQGVAQGTRRFMWPDAVGTFLFDKFASKK